MAGRSQVSFHRCNSSAFIHMVICVIFTLVVQVILTVRSVPLHSAAADGALTIIPLQNLCNHDETQAHRWMFPRCSHSPIRAWRFHDIFGGKGCGCVPSI